MYRELNEITELELTDKCFNNYINNPYRLLGVLCNENRQNIEALINEINSLNIQNKLSDFVYKIDNKILIREKIKVNKINEIKSNLDNYENKIFTFLDPNYVKNLFSNKVYKEFFESRKFQNFDCFIASYFYMLVVDKNFESLSEWDSIFDYINKVISFNINNINDKNKFVNLIQNRFNDDEKSENINYVQDFKAILDCNIVNPIIEAINEIENIKILGNILRYISKYENDCFRNIESIIYYKVLDIIKADNDEINRDITVKKLSLDIIVSMSKEYIKNYYPIVYNLPSGEKDNIVLQQIRDKYYVQIRNFVNLLLFNGKYQETEYVIKDIIKCSGKVYKEEAKRLYENITEIIKGYNIINNKIEKAGKDVDSLSKDEQGFLKINASDVRTTFYRAMAGNIEAQYVLGIMINEGKLGSYLTKSDEVKFGLKWIETAANNKNIKAMKYLYMYNVNQANNCDKKSYKGKKVFKTKVARADKWLQKLIEVDNEDAKKIASSKEYKELIKDINKQEGCYIATAVYGSYEDEHVRVLRNFRDRKLLESGIGTKFVELYYKYSPVYAEKLENKKVINNIVKMFLNIFVKMLNKKYKD